MLTFQPSPLARATPRSGRPVLVPTSRVRALRAAAVIAPGQLATRGALAAADGACVPAVDVDGCGWWVPAPAVWLDGTRDAEHPRAVGLATATTLAGAMLTGLSDRLGHEAVAAGDLPLLAAGHLTRRLGDGAVVFDGRVGHDVPTVVVATDTTLRWGAGLSWDAALSRALHGNGAAAETELRAIAHRLRDAGLTLASVDLATPLLSAHGIIRRSIQLLVAV